MVYYTLNFNILWNKTLNAFKLFTYNTYDYKKNTSNLVSEYYKIKMNIVDDASTYYASIAKFCAAIKWNETQWRTFYIFSVIMS